MLHKVLKRLERATMPTATTTDSHRLCQQAHALLNDLVALYRCALTHRRAVDE